MKLNSLVKYDTLAYSKYRHQQNADTWELIKKTVTIVIFPLGLYLYHRKIVNSLTKEIERLNYVIERKQYHAFNQKFRCTSPTRLEETTTTQTRTMYFDR